MNIRALETSSFYGSVAGLVDGALILHHELRTDQRTAQSLAPAVARILQDLNWRPRDVDLIAVTQGPGSFTGLRVGVTLAKTMAYALGAQVLGVHTLDVIATQAPTGHAKLSCVLDAHRQQAFCKSFRRGDGQSWEAGDDTRTIGIDQYVAELTPDIAVSGPLAKKIRTLVGAEITFVDEARWSPSATTVGQLAWREYSAGRRDDVWKLVPSYYRPSAAEEKHA